MYAAGRGCEDPRAGRPSLRAKPLVDGFRVDAEMYGQLADREKTLHNLALHYFLTSFFWIFS